MFEKCLDLARECLANSAILGLGFLLEECDYKKAIESGLAERIDIPLVRRNCVKLSIAMAKAGYESEESISEWLKCIDSDPLPEIRNLTVDQ